MTALIDTCIIIDFLQRREPYYEDAYCIMQHVATEKFDWEVASVLIGASRPEQIAENISIVEHLDFSGEKLDEIDRICGIGI